MPILTSGITRRIASLMKSGEVREAMRVMSDRSYMFKSDLAMKLTAISLIPAARQSLEDYMDSEWDSDSLPEYSERRYTEAVIGGGLHAGIYAAARVARGFEAPLVIERGRVGGIFAISKRPTFYLNSNNRPGKLALPGDNLSALNYLPGAPIQPSFVSSREYQTNADIAFVTRLTLALTANVRKGTVTSVEYDRFSIGPATRYTLRLANGGIVRVSRVIDARGLGDARNVSDADGKLVQTYPQFLASLDAVCPLRGLERVAVIGGGDSGKTAVEALLGIGPDAMMTVTALDYVRTIDWYAESLPQTCQAWRDEIRGRYQRIGSYLPKRGRPGRVTVIPRKGIVAKALDSVLVNGQSYDRVIDCSGFVLSDGIRTDDFDFFERSSYPSTSEPIAQRYATDYYAIGPAANLDFTRSELSNDYPNIGANRVAIFRLANRTSALGTSI